MRKKISLGISIFLISSGLALAQSVVPDRPEFKEIVQFNNLRITEIVSSNEFRAVTTFDFPNPCLKFESTGAKNPIAFPCPMPLETQNQPRNSSEGRQFIMPEIIYTLKTSPQTIFLLRDRARASFSDFRVNDRINVYGFYDADTNSVESLILRNLSKPKERKFIQLNNLEITNISSVSLPAVITAVQNFSNPCYDYGTRGSFRHTMPCPMGMSMGTDESRFPSREFRKYKIDAINSATLLDRNRNRISFDKITIGDKINVYGLFDEEEQTVEALILRDISKPSQNEEIIGTITAVNADGSFVLRTDSGEEFTVNPRMAVGARVEISGFINRVSKIISDLTRLIVRR